MGLRPTQEDENMRTRKLWVPHISRSEMWEGCRTAVGEPEETAGVLNPFRPDSHGCAGSSLPQFAAGRCLSTERSAVEVPDSLDPNSRFQGASPLSPCHPDRSEAEWRDLQSSRKVENLTFPPPPAVDLRGLFLGAECTRISCFAVLATTTCAAHCKREPHALHQRHESQQEIRGSADERSAVYPPAQLPRTHTAD